MIMKQLKKQISEKEETTSKPLTNLLTFNSPLIKKLVKGLLALTFLAIVSLLTTALLEVPIKAMNSNSENTSTMENSLYISKVRNYSELLSFANGDQIGLHFFLKKIA